MDLHTTDECVTIDLPQRICVRGQADCQVISGRVLCEGKEFGQDETFLLYSPTSHHAIEIVPLQLDVQIMFKRIKPLPIEEGINSQLFPPADWAKAEDLIVDGLTRSNEAGFAATDRLSEVLDKVRCGTRLMVMGGKSSGKSSTNRFIVNRLLNSGYAKVYWFECDPGQPEFNVSGWLSLVEVTKARVGPGFPFLQSKTHFTTLASSFLGELSPGNNPSHYIRCIMHLKKTLDQLSPEIPVVFNAMGWLRHLGLKLNLDIIRVAGIELVYYLKTGTSNDLPDELKPESLMSEDGFKETHRIKTDKNVKVIADKSVSTSAIQARRGLSNNNREWHARQLRDVASSMFIQNWMNLAEVNWVGFANIALNFSDGKPSNIFHVLNNSMVSLSRVNVLPQPDEHGFCAFSNMQESISSLGFGWIRHVNIEERKINIHTSLPIADLITLGINCIVIGHIPLSDQIANCSGKTIEHRPYVHVRDTENVTANKFKATYQMRKRKAD